MKTSVLRPLVRSLALAGVVALAAAVGSASAQGLRAEVGKPLQQASDLLRAGKARDALAKVREAESASGITASERLTINRMKAAAAQRAGDTGTAIQALEGVAGSVSGSELGQIAEQLAAAYAQQRNNGKASEWLQKAVAAGNNSATVRQLQQYLMAASGDYNAIARDSGAAVAAAEQAGRRPDEGELLRLADAQQRLGQTNAYVGTLEKLLLNYPKKDYWNAYLGRLTRKPGFSQRLALDVMRLRLASGTLTETADFMEMAQLSLQERLPAEVLGIIEQGFKSGALGKGPEAARHERLRELALKRDAEQKAAIDGQAADAEREPGGEELVKVGYAYVTRGDVERGVELIRKGIAKGSLKHPDEAKLRLGMAQRQSAKTRAAGTQTLRSIRGNDGTAEVARLWTIVSNGS